MPPHLCPVQSVNPSRTETLSAIGLTVFLWVGGSQSGQETQGTWDLREAGWERDKDALQTIAWSKLLRWLGKTEAHWVRALWYQPTVKSKSGCSWCKIFIRGLGGKTSNLHPFTGSLCCMISRDMVKVFVGQELFGPGHKITTVASKSTSKWPLKELLGQKVGGAFWRKPGAKMMLFDGFGYNWVSPQCKPFSCGTIGDWRPSDRPCDSWFPVHGQPSQPINGGGVCESSCWQCGRYRGCVVGDSMIVLGGAVCEITVLKGKDWRHVQWVCDQQWSVKGQPRGNWGKQGPAEVMCLKQDTRPKWSRLG